MAGELRRAKRAKAEIEQHSRILELDASQADSLIWRGLASLKLDPPRTAAAIRDLREGLRRAEASGASSDLDRLCMRLAHAIDEHKKRGDKRKTEAN